MAMACYDYSELINALINEHADDVEKEEEEECKDRCKKLSLRLVNFAENFQNQFIEKLLDYQKEAEGKSIKLNKRTQVLNYILMGFGGVLGGTTSFLTGFGLHGIKPGLAAGNQSGKVILKTIDTHKKKATNITLKLQHQYQQEEEQQQLNLILIKIAVKIFIMYEQQFMNTLFKEDKDWLTNKEDLIKDAIKQIINYIEININKVNKEEETKFENIALNAFNNALNKNKSLLPPFKWSFAKINKKSGLLNIINTQNTEVKKIFYWTEENKAPKYGFIKLITDLKIDKKEEYKEEIVEYNYLLDFKKLDLIADLILKLITTNSSSSVITGDIKDVHRDVIAVKNLVKETQNNNNNKKFCKYKNFVNVIPPVANFTGREDKLLEINYKLRTNNNLGRISQAVCICGVGGIGKTELTRRYIQLFSEEYDENVIWINAEDQSSNFYPNYNNNQNEKCNKKCLYIFDNVNSFEEIDKLFPKLHLKFAYFIITSQLRNWNVGQEGKIEIVELLDFNEAFDFVKTNLNEEKPQDIHVLIDLLHNLPLALQQAITFIKIKQEEINLTLSIKNKKYTILDYVNEFNTLNSNKAKELLSKHFAVNNCDQKRYLNTVYTTWNVTLNLIEKNNKEYGKEAVKIMKIIAYIQPHFELTFFNNKYRFESLLLLNKYSMINVFKGRANVHRLVQKVIRIKTQEEQQESVVLKEILSNFDLNSFDNIFHFGLVWRHLCKHPEIIKDYTKMLSSINEIPFNSFYLTRCEKALEIILNNINLQEENLNDVIKHEILLPAIASNNLNIVKKCVEKIDFTNLPSLFQNAIEYGNLELIKYFAEELNVKLNSSVLQLSVSFAIRSPGKSEIVDYLIKDKKMRCKLKLVALISSIENLQTFEKFQQYLNYLKLIQENVFENDLINILYNSKMLIETAVEINYPRVLELLFKQGLIVEEDRFGMPILIEAIYFEKEHAVKDLIYHYYEENNKKELLNKILYEEENALFYACLQSKTSILKMLLNDFKINNEVIFKMPYYRKSELLLYKYLIDENFVDIYAKDDLKRTPLFILVRCSRTDLIKYVIEKKSGDLNAKDIYGNTLLHYATTLSDNDLFSFRCFSPNMNKYDQILHEFNQNDNDFIIDNHRNAVFNTVKLLLKCGINPNVCDNHKRSGLIFVAYHSFFETIPLFLHCSNLSVNDCDCDGRTSLHYSVMYENYGLINHIITNCFQSTEQNINYNNNLLTRPYPNYRKTSFKTVKILLNCGAFNTCFDKFGCTALHYVCLFGYLELCKLLMVKNEENECLINVRDLCGNTPLHYAAINGNVDLLEAFLDAGFVTYDNFFVVTNNKKRNLFHYLALCNNYLLESCKKLLRKLLSNDNLGLDLLAKDDFNCNPLDYARLYKNVNFIEAIQEFIT